MNIYNDGKISVKTGTFAADKFVVIRDETNIHVMTNAQAISAARAILKHFNVGVE